MKVLRCAMLLLSLFSTGILYAQFEGEVDLKTTNPTREFAKEVPIAVFVKGDNIAFKILEGRGKEMGLIVFRPDKKVLWMMNDKEKSYFELPTDQGTGDLIRERMKETKKESKKPSFRKTGKTKTLLGYSCEEIIVEGENSVTDLWATTKLGNIYEGFRKAFSGMRGGQMDGSSSGWEEEMMNMHLFPLASTKTKDGKVVETEEVMKIDQRQLDASMFEPPADYKKQEISIDMNKMMNGMGGQMKNDANEGKNDMMKNPDMQKLMEQMKEKLKNMNRRQGGDSTNDKDSTEDKDNE